MVSPVLLVRWGVIAFAEVTVGTFLAFLRKQKESKTKFQDKLSVVAIVKNEAPYIKEWIEFHKLVGVTRFYIYDNDSEDDLKSVLQPYIENGEVICKYYSGTSMQLSAYNDAIRNYKSNSKYMAFIDLDEFLVPCVHGKLLSETIDDILNSEIHAGGIGVTWRVFGSSGYVKKPEGLVTENYLKRAVDNCWQNWHIKTVCNPRLIKEYVSPHFPIYKLGNWNINENGRRLRGWFSLGQCYEKIKLNHYFCKSREEALAKWNRGLADRDEKYDWTKFEQHDLNDVYDDGMLEYASEIKMVLSGKR